MTPIPGRRRHAGEPEHTVEVTTQLAVCSVCSAPLITRDGRPEGSLTLVPAEGGGVWVTPHAAGCRVLLTPGVFVVDGTAVTLHLAGLEP